MITTKEAAVHAANYESHHIDARRRSTDELVRIAAEAKAKGTPVTFKDIGEVNENFCHRRMPGPEQLSPHRERLPQQRFGFGVFSLKLKYPAELAQRGGDIGMLRSQVFLPNA